MKNLRMKYNSWLMACLLLLALLPASCIKDDYAARDKATVTMTFTTRAENIPQYSSSLLDNEQMKTLRVIVARHDDETGESSDILYNVKYNIEPQETSKTITFSELTINESGEYFDFYAIANEEGITTLDFENLTSIDLKEWPLNCPVIAAIGTKSIPQTAFKTILVKPTEDGSIQRENMQLEFVVAKVRLTINNTSTESQTVSDIKLSGVNTTSTKLFAESSSTENSGSVDLGEMEISAENKSTVYAYFYENTGGDYVLSATWNGEKTLRFGSGTTYNIGSIPRGRMLDINVNLSVNTKPTINVLVIPWDEKSMDVEFN